MGERSKLSDFKLMGKLGSGTYGVVWKVVRKLDSTTYALKEIALSGLSRKEQEECVHEVHILARLNNQHIIKYYDCFIENGKLYIVMEYAPAGNLHDYINRCGRRGLPEDVVWRLLLQAALALAHMHAQRVLHRDIKSLNIFLGDGGAVKLGDFGVAKVLSTQTSFARTVIGTPYYLSPELCSDRPYGVKSDVWALGVVLYECCTGQHPFDADNQGALIVKILRGRYKPVDSCYSEGLRDIVKRCLSQSAVARPTCERLLMLPAVRAKAKELHIPLPTFSRASSAPSAQRVVSRPGSCNDDAPPSGTSCAPPRPPLARPPAAKRPRALAAGSKAAVIPGLQKPISAGGVLRRPGETHHRTKEAASDGHDAVRAGPRPNNAQSCAFRFGRASSCGQQETAASQPVVSCASKAAAADTVAGNPVTGTSGASDVVATWDDVPNRERPSSGVLGSGHGDKEQDLWRVCDAMQRQSLGAEADGVCPSSEEDECDSGPGRRSASWEAVHGSPEGDTEGVQDWQQDEKASKRAVASAIAVLKAEVVNMIGTSTFERLYKFMKGRWQDEGEDDVSITDLSTEIFRIIPHDKADVITLMYKVLYQEDSIGL